MAKKKDKNPKADPPGNPVDQSPADDQNPPAPDPVPKDDKKSGNSKFQIKNLVRANQAVYGITPRKPVVFDEDGIAVVSKAEYEHFLKVPGYKKA